MCLGFQHTEKVCHLNGRVGFNYSLIIVGQHPTKSTTSREYITKQMQNRRSYLPKIEIALRMLTHSPWKEMQLGMLITNCQVYSTAIDKFADLVSQVHLLNQPLQSLYDEQTTNESADEENEVESLFINPQFSNEEENYIPNAFCKEFTVKSVVWFKKQSSTKSE